MPRLLLLVPATTYRAEAFTRAALALEVDLVIGAAESNPLQAQLPERFLTLDLADPDAAAQQAVRYAERYPIDAVIGVDDPTVVVGAAIAAALGIDHNPIAAAQASRNKFEMRRLLAAAGLDGPSFSCLELSCDLHLEAQRQDYPVVLKPTELGASRGVIRADNAPEFIDAFVRIAAMLRPEDRILVESYIPGDEVALEGLLIDGELKMLALFDKPDPLVGPFFEETIYLTPSRLPQSTQQAILDCATRAAAALELKHGPVHAELRHNDAGVWLLELAARTIGGLCGRTLRFGSGMSLEEVVLRHALKLEISSLARQPEPSGVMMIPIPQAGVLTGIDGLEQARGIAFIEAVTITAHLRQLLTPLPEGQHYLGFIFARAQTVDQVEAALREAHRVLRFSFDCPDTRRSS